MARAKNRSESLFWNPPDKHCDRCGIRMRFQFDFARENLEWQQINAEQLYNDWQRCGECWEVVWQERASDKTLHNELAAFRSLSVREQQRRAMGLFDELPDDVPTVITESEFIKISELMKLLGMSRTAVMAWLADYRVPTNKIGKSVAVRRADVFDLIEGHKVS